MPLLLSLKYMFIDKSKNCPSKVYSTIFIKLLLPVSRHTCKTIGSSLLAKKFIP